jgi:hypothetical protein
MGLAVMEELSGIDSGVTDPYAFFAATLGGWEHRKRARIRILRLAHSAGRC